MELKHCRAITLWEPWASLVAAKIKQCETRSWATDYRGPLLIHSAKRKPRSTELFRILQSVNHPRVEDVLKKVESGKTLGKVVAFADLTECEYMTSQDLEKVSEDERVCGNWQVGRYAWELQNVVALPGIDAIGKQGLWIPDNDLLAKVINALAF
ncbi:MAG TPA: ASCH domain-containing protein [Vampirovibrionales bacterium]